MAEVSERLLSKELVRREQDVLWRARYRPPDDCDTHAHGKTETEGNESWFYVFVHLEHERRGRKLMVLDALQYRILAWKDMARRRLLSPSGKLWPILTVVFYNGARKASMAKALGAVIEPVPGAPPELFDPTRIVVVDASHDALPNSGGTPSPLVSLFRLEQLEELGELPEITGELSGLLGDAPDSELGDAFVALINTTVLPRLQPPDVADDDRLRISDLEEVPSMLAQRIDRAMDRARERLRQELTEELTEELTQKLLAQGEAQLIVEQLSWRFGGVPEWARTRVMDAEPEQLKHWARRMFQAQSLEDVFAD